MGGWVRQASGWKVSQGWAGGTSQLMEGESRVVGWEGGWAGGASQLMEGESEVGRWEGVYGVCG